MCACLPAWRVLIGHLSRKSKRDTEYGTSGGTYGRSTTMGGSKALEGSLGKGNKSCDLKIAPPGGGAMWMGHNSPTITTPRQSHRFNGIGSRTFVGNASSGHGHRFYSNDDDSIELIQQHPDPDDAHEPEADSPPPPPPK